MQYNNTVFIGPDYRKPKGGISAVLAVYAKYIEPFIFIPSYDGNKGNWGNLLLFGRSIMRLIKLLAFKKNIDKVHIHGSHKGSVYRKAILIFIAQNIFKRKAIYHLHSSSFDVMYNEGSTTYKNLCKWAIENAAMVIALSPSWYNYYNSAFRPRKLCILNNVIDYPETKNDENLSLKKSGVIKILFLGEIGQRKGVYDLLKVIIDNRNNWGGKVLFQVGGNGEVQNLEDIIETKELHNLVQYIGWVDTGKKISYLRDADIYILPSYNEGLPISILEAMSYNLPIISTNVGGIPEVVSNGKNGYLIEPGNLPHLTKCIEDIAFADGKTRKQMGLVSQEIVSAYYPKDVFENLERLYKEI